ncbi:MAG: type I-C CRISPR-associated endonuclease Cas1c [Oscillospiraceae bacterium]|nr:type I-C CRISPR-associated endonuclease Cas1c [Oscillospiraceae bacterium]
MRKLHNILYVTHPDAYLSLDGENAVILEKDQEVKRIPLHNLEGIITFGYTGASPALMHHCAELGIALTFLSAHGRFLCRVEGEKHGNILLRKEQYRVSDDENRSLEAARYIVCGKLYNERAVLLRAMRDHSMQFDCEKISNAAERITRAITMTEKCLTLEELRGIEGEAANAYFGVFDLLILQNKNDFFWCGRTRRPPTDNVNALLSFCYSLLTHDCAAGLESAGLDSYAGFLHRDRPGRQSLALDLMEEFRAPMCDRFVLSIINTRQVNASGFLQKENSAVIMDDNTRRDVLVAWQKRKQEEIIHPFLGEKAEWGVLPLVQAQLLARYIRGDIDAYPPFLWR